MIVDGLVLRIRENHRVRQKSALVAIGVNRDGYREVLGLQVGQKETKRSWKEFFLWLKHRGLRDVEVLVSDAHEGLKQAAFQVFQEKTVWQRCQFHFIRNILEVCPAEHEDDLHERLKEMLEASSKARAREKLQECLEEFEDKASQAMDIP